MTNAKEKGVTLVALIITIIVLVILAAVSIKAVYDSRMVGIAANGTMNYAKATNIENALLDETADKLDSIIGGINFNKEDLPIIAVENENIWANRKNITISKINGLETVYTTDGTEPSNTNGKEYTGSFYVEENCTIKAIYMTNSGVVGNIAAKDVTMIDETNPVAEIGNIATYAALNANISIEVTLTDEGGSELNLNKCKWVFSTESGEIGTDESKYTDTFESETQTIEYTSSEEGTYYLHILATDNAGNSKEIIGSSGTAFQRYFIHL